MQRHSLKETINDISDVLAFHEEQLTDEEVRELIEEHVLKDGMSTPNENRN